MADNKLRQAIAAEAARLLQQGKEPDFRSARRKAARWYSRQRVAPADMPSFAEIQREVFALAGLFSAERQSSALTEIRLVARELMTLLSDFQPRLAGSAVCGPVMPGAEIELRVAGDDWSAMSAILFDAGHQDVSHNESGLTLFDHYPCVVKQREPDDMAPVMRDIDLQQLDALLKVQAEREARRGDDVEDGDEFAEDEYHPDFFPTLNMLLNSLEQVRLDPDKHPEGDLLYHTLQVYELGLAERPYDEEFLLACLLHDVGMGLDRRRPLEAAWQAVGSLVTDRTWFFIENRAEAVEYLSTGKIRGSLRRSEDFEDLILLAKCDLKGRLRGAKVGTVEEALEYIEGLSTQWDEDD